MRTINLSLVGLDGNAFSLIGAFSKQAKREGWTQEEVSAVVDEATSAGWDNLLTTLDEHCEPTE